MIWLLLGSSGAFDISWFHGLSAGKTEILFKSAGIASHTGGVEVVVDDDVDDEPEDDDVVEVDPDEEPVPVVAVVPVVFGFEVVVVLLCCVSVVGAMSGFLLQPQVNNNTSNKIGRRSRLMVVLNGLYIKRLR